MGQGISTFATIIVIVAGLFSIVATIVGAIAILRSNLVRTRLTISDEMIVALRGDRDDLQNRLSRVELELERTRALLGAANLPKQGGEI